MGKHAERVSQDDSLKLDAASHNITSWYIDTDGFLEHFPSGGNPYYEQPALQNIISGFLASLINILSHRCLLRALNVPCTVLSNPQMLSKHV